LYDIEADPNETTDLSGKHSDVVERLEKAFVETRTVEPNFPSKLYDSRSRRDPSFGNSEIKSKLGPFGTLMKLEIEFVDKNRTYFQQNIVKEKYMARVTSVNNIKLTTPFTMQYVFTGDEEQRKEAANFLKGRTYKFEGYESIYEMGPPYGWRPGSQFYYSIRKRLILRFPTKE
jgi:hypothetical protein